MFGRGGIGQCQSDEQGHAGKNGRHQRNGKKKKTALDY